MSLTFLQAQTQLASFSGNGSVKEQINLVLERILTGGQWKQAVQEFTIDIFSFTDQWGNDRYQFTLPARAETVEGIMLNTDFGQTRGRPVHAPYYRYTDYGIECCGLVNSGAIDCGDGWSVFRDPPIDSYLRARVDYPETATLSIRGIGTDGNPIFSGTNPNIIEGITLNLASAPVTSAVQFKAGSRIEVVKSAVTKGPVRLYSWDGTTETLLAYYMPSELVPSYRRYESPRWDRYQSATVVAKLRHVDLVADNDMVIPPSRYALEMGMRGLNFDRKHDLERAQVFWGNCFDILNNQLRQHQSNQLPKMTVSVPNHCNFRQIQ